MLGVGPEAITLDLEFRSDEHAKDQPVTFTPVDPHRGKIEFVNWDQPLSTTFAAPVEVGTAQNRRLYLIFSIRRIGSTGALREIHLTALLGEMV